GSVDHEDQSRRCHEDEDERRRDGRSHEHPTVERVRAAGRNRDAGVRDGNAMVLVRCRSGSSLAAANRKKESSLPGPI
ncbi:MAG TPA: hypothetical protein VEY12_00905, partial [Thermoplasmata archaeon]|nr:hypothetical protein [Thermoplasmata archaeon]